MAGSTRSPQPQCQSSMVTPAGGEVRKPDGPTFRRVFSGFGCHTGTEVPDEERWPEMRTSAIGAANAPGRVRRRTCSPHGDQGVVTHGDVCTSRPRNRR